MLYAEALHEHLEAVARGSPRSPDYDPVSDGVAIVARIIGRRYLSVFSFSFCIRETILDQIVRFHVHPPTFFEC